MSIGRELKYPEPLQEGVDRDDYYYAAWEVEGSPEMFPIWSYFLKELDSNGIRSALGIQLNLLTRFKALGVNIDESDIKTSYGNFKSEMSKYIESDSLKAAKKKISDDLESKLKTIKFGNIDHEASEYAKNIHDFFGEQDQLQTDKFAFAVLEILDELFLAIRKNDEYYRFIKAVKKTYQDQILKNDYQVFFDKQQKDVLAYDGSKRKVCNLIYVLYEGRRRYRVSEIRSKIEAARKAGINPGDSTYPRIQYNELNDVDELAKHFSDLVDKVNYLFSGHEFFADDLKSLLNAANHHRGAEIKEIERNVQVEKKEDELAIVSAPPASVSALVPAQKSKSGENEDKVQTPKFIKALEYAAWILAGAAVGLGVFFALTFFGYITIPALVIFVGVAVACGVGGGGLGGLFKFVKDKIFGGSADKKIAAPSEPAREVGVSEASEETSTLSSSSKPLKRTQSSPDLSKSSSESVKIDRKRSSSLSGAGIKIDPTLFSNRKSEGSTVSKKDDTESDSESEGFRPPKK